MRIPDLKGVQVITKPERGRYEDRDVWEKSSNIVTYNVYEQSWADLEREGLTHLFFDEQDFERRKQAHSRPQRKFMAYAVKQGDEVGIGIEEYNEAYTLSIASIYVTPKPSNKDLFDIIARHVMNALEPEETALLRANRQISTKYPWTLAYNGRLFVRNEYNDQMDFYQTKLLAEDGLQRKDTVTEVFNEPIQYVAEGVEIYSL